jgi:hypothetical protein
MKSQHKKLASFALFLASPMVMAGPPMAYSQWSVDNGVITTDCAADVTCNTLVSSDGMLYESIDTGGNEFLRLIITESGATGDPKGSFGETDPKKKVLGFSDETFIPFSLDNGTNDGNSSPYVQGLISQGYNSFAAPQGIASRQAVMEEEDQFVATTEVQRANMRQYNGGWSSNDVAATSDEMFSVKIDQSFDDGEMASDFSQTSYTQFMASFEARDPNTGELLKYVDPVTGVETQVFTQDPDTDYVIGRKTHIGQTLDMTDNATPTGTQVFVQRSGEGYKGTASPESPLLGTWFNAGPGTVGQYFTSEPITTTGSMNISGGTDTAVTWNDAQNISTTWLTQSEGPGGSIGYHAVTNKDTMQSDSELIFNQPTGGPDVWDVTNFGAQPSTTNTAP